MTPCKAVANFSPTNGTTYLRVVKDDVLTIDSWRSDDYAMCINSSGEKGLVPGICLQLEDANMKHPFLDDVYMKEVKRITVDSKKYMHYNPVDRHGKNYDSGHLRHDIQCLQTNEKAEVCNRRPHRHYKPAEIESESKQMVDELQHKCTFSKPKFRSRIYSQIMSIELLLFLFLEFMSKVILSFTSATSDCFYSFVYGAMTLARQNPTVPLETLFPRYQRQKISELINDKGQQILTNFLMSLKNFYVSIQIDSAKLVDQKLTIATIQTPFLSRKSIVIDYFIGSVTQDALVAFGVRVYKRLKSFGIRVISVTTDTLRHQIASFDLQSDNCIYKLINEGIIPYGASCTAHVLNLCYCADILKEKPLFNFNNKVYDIFKKSIGNKCNVIVKRWLVIFDIFIYLLKNDSDKLQNISKLILIFGPAREASLLFERLGSTYICVFPIIVQLILYYDWLMKKWIKDIKEEYYYVLSVFSNNVYKRFIYNDKMLELSLISFSLTVNGRRCCAMGEFLNVSMFKEEFKLKSFPDDQISPDTQQEQKIKQRLVDDGQNMKLNEVAELNEKSSVALHLLRQPKITGPKLFFNLWRMGDEIAYDDMFDSGYDEVEYFKVLSLDPVYKNIGVFALHMLGCACTEASCERVFAILRRIVNCHRKRLLIKTIISLYIFLSN
ncbi:MAG: hypothetical protein EZS28_001088 [Streblomastix strix]|uniref:SH3 domain-containing protein n=1 Tax=Streblomastix strix TaxID=222440 RepID=A0A5J4X8A2_9EUKA|nr:MAG: hypothetical protein EZS28_001088 [Streblomastix strix]